MVNHYDKSNVFDRLVIKHYKLKNKRHVSGDKNYSDYDVLVGLQAFIFISVWIFVSFSFATLVLIPLLFCWLLNNIEFIKKNGIKNVRR